MAENMQKSPSFWEKTDYDVLSESESEKEYTAVIRNRFSGAEGTCHIPKHSAEEERQLAEELTRVLMQIGFTEEELSECAEMEIKGE